MGLLLSVPSTCFLLHSSLPCASVAARGAEPLYYIKVHPPLTGALSILADDQKEEG